MTVSGRAIGLAGAAALAATAVVVMTPAPASAAPDHQVPFECGETVIASTRRGHSPSDNAVDFQKPGIQGMPVLASAPGTVTAVRNAGNTSYGRWVEIDHGEGHRTLYAHLDSQSVSEGQSVGQGTQIGTAGNTGGSTGPHLHYEQKVNGSLVPVVFDGAAVTYFDRTSLTSNNCDETPYPPELLLLPELWDEMEDLIDGPDVRLQPPEDQAAIVNIPTFVEDQSSREEIQLGPRCAASVCVTLTGTPTLTFDPGEPGAQTIDCELGGTRFDPDGPDPSDQAAVEGACAYAYQNRTTSAPHPGRVEIVWTFTWSSTSGYEDDFDALTLPADDEPNAPRVVEEVQTTVTDIDFGRPD